MKEQKKLNSWCLQSNCLFTRPDYASWHVLSQFGRHAISPIMCRVVILAHLGVGIASPVTETVKATVTNDTSGTTANRYALKKSFLVLKYFNLLEFFSDYCVGQVAPKRMLRIVNLSPTISMVMKGASF